MEGKKIDHITQLIKKYPNDQDLGREIRKLIDKFILSENCCANINNHRKSGESRKICIVCGEIINGK